MYLGELNFSNQSSEDIFDLLMASDELLLEGLFKNVQDHLLENCTGWIQQNLDLVTNPVFRLADCKNLQDHCLESIRADPQTFITSKNFPSLDDDILCWLLERNDL